MRFERCRGKYSTTVHPNGLVISRRSHTYIFPDVIQYPGGATGKPRYTHARTRTHTHTHTHTHTSICNCIVVN